ncbi:chromosome segregation protein [Microcystis phage vB_MweS-yong2]|nr:chromosome segregation protein [Microcystis phage vB_MweS-yong2]
MNESTLPLSALEPAPSNVRVTERDAGIKALAASIKAHGLLQPLVVIPHDGPGPGKYLVADGARRLAALRKIHGKRDPDIPVRFLASLDDGAAREASLAANVMRVALHPVDEYEAFARLVADGLTEAQVADRFGVAALEVRKRLRLAALAPEVREAWRGGKLDGEQARAFAASSDLEAQAEALPKVLRASSHWDRNPEAIRRMVRGRLVSMLDPDVKLIGLDAYKAAGGEVEEDLFSDKEGRTMLKDRALVERLARERIEAECARLVALGWAWARPAMDVRDIYDLPRPDFAAHATEGERAALSNKNHQARFEAERAINERLKADPSLVPGAGLLVEVQHSGALRTRGPFLSAEARRDEDDPAQDGQEDEQEDGDEDEWAATPAPPPAEPEEEGPDVPHPTRLAVSEGLTAALAEALARSPHVALPALVATLRVRMGYYSAAPLRLDPDHKRPEGSTAQGREIVRREIGWHEAFAELESGPVDRLMAEMAGYAARLLDLRDLKNDDRAARGWDREACARAIAAALPADDVREALNARFDAAAYFPKIPAALIDAAVAEMGGPAPKGRKADKAALAAGLAAQTGWLPEALRTAHYQGPGSPAFGTSRELNQAAE